MDIWDKFKSKSGYHMNDDGTDSLGVDHSNFNIRDELKYQIDRVNNEQQQSMTSGQTPTPWSPQAAQASARTTSRFEKIQTPWSTGNETTPSVASSTVPIPQTTLQPVQTSTPQAQASALTNADTTLWSGGYNNYTLDNQKRQCNVSSGMQCAPQNGNYIANMTPISPDYSQLASLEFDGKNLIWLQNGQPVKYYPAMSGHEGFQGVQYTNVANDGPIPEGDYLLAQGSGQDYTENLWYKINRNMWPRPIRKNWTVTPAGWGHQRIPIQPLPNTNTFGRHSMYIHGGDNGFGSAGCIDLERGMPNFYNDWLEYNGTLPLEVKYPKGW